MNKNFALLSWIVHEQVGWLGHFHLRVVVQILQMPAYFFLTIIFLVWKKNKK